MNLFPLIEVYREHKLEFISYYIFLKVNMMLKGERDGGLGGVNKRH